MFKCKMIFQNGIRNRPSTANGQIPKTSKKDKSKRPRSAVSSSHDVSVKPLCWKPNSRNSSGSLIPDSKSQSFAFHFVSIVMAVGANDLWVLLYNTALAVFPTKIISACNRTEPTTSMTPQI